MRITLGGRPDRFRDMPTGLFYCLVIYGTFALVASLALLVAPFDLGSYTINGEVVSGPEFLRRAGPLLAALCLASGVATVGLFRRSAWARPAVLVPPLLGIGVGVLVAAREGEAPTIWEAAFLTVIIVALWSYLFRRKSVDQYFGRLRDEATEAERLQHG